MEDRITPVLYLEMTDQDQNVYASLRVPEVLAHPAVTRATWWANCAPGRTDLPRTLPEFHLLGVYEAEETFRPPEPTGGIRGLQFAHYRRPGQGTISSSPTLGLELVLISPRSPAEAQTLRDWADFVHIRDIAAAAPPHFTMITPYENVGDAGPRFLHFYELDTEDAEPAFQGMTPATLERVGTPGTHPARQWMGHEALVIDYVSTFRRLGVKPA
jgi:hypothetical protein